MCGIVGFVGAAEWLSRLRPDLAVDSIAHRGPDGAGTWRSYPREDPNGTSPPACVLGHTRLSIIDLTDAGRQPMATADGRYVLVYNGEVYNFLEIRRELEEMGDTFASTGDSEVVLKACVRWGERAVERFRGMFAFGFWDDSARTLLLARDRLGVKPLYVTRVSGGLAFASEVRALVASGACTRVLSPRGLLGYLRYGSVQEPDTLVSGVFSLAPGSTMLFDGRQACERKYWAVPCGPPARVPRAEAVSRTRELLRESVRLRLVSDVPFGIFLSGGGDSSALTALAAMEASRPVHTFTVIFDEASYSEEKWAGEIARGYGTVHHTVHVTGQAASRELDQAFSDQDQPSGDGLNTWLVSRAARREGLAMALSGLGGDEIFAGYPSFRRVKRLLYLSRLGRWTPSRVLSAFEKWTAVPACPQKLRKAVVLGGASGDPAKLHGALRSLFTDRQIEMMVTEPALGWMRTEQAPSLAAGSSGDAVNDLSRYELTHYLRDTLLRDTDSMSMAASLEVRVPFLDHKLVEQVLSLSGQLKLEGECNKALLFDAVPELPRDIGRRRKVGFVLPLGPWFRGPMKTAIEDSLLGERGESAGFLRASMMSAMWRAFLAGDGAVSDSRIFALASLSRWIAEHRMETPW
jgi:asparagine synthase (glutamine-hydrolysing)